MGYYSCTTLKDNPWWPGSSAARTYVVINIHIDIENHLFMHRYEGLGQGAPHVEIPDGIIDYYMFELGHFGGAAIKQIIFDEVTNDYYMYTLHHMCAVLLIVSSCVSNSLGIGTLVLFHLDLADIFTNSASGFGKTEQICPLQSASI